MSSIDDLRARIEELEGLLGVDDGRVGRIMQRFRMSRREAQLVGFIALREVATRDALTTAVWESGREPDSNAVSVMIGRARRQLQLVEIEVHPVRGVGYAMSAAHRERFNRLVR